MRHFTIVRWEESAAEFEAARRRAWSGLLWTALRFVLILGPALWGFWWTLRRYSPEMPAGRLLLGGVLYSCAAFVFYFVVARWRIERGEYRVTTRGIVPPNPYDRMGSWLWRRWDAYRVEAAAGGRVLRLFKKGSERNRIPLPGDERDEMIVNEVRRRLRAEVEEACAKFGTEETRPASGPAKLDG